MIALAEVVKVFLTVALGFVVALAVAAEYVLPGQMQELELALELVQLVLATCTCGSFAASQKAWQQQEEADPGKQKKETNQEEEEETFDLQDQKEAVQAKMEVEE